MRKLNKVIALILSGVLLFSPATAMGAGFSNAEEELLQESFTEENMELPEQKAEMFQRAEEESTEAGVKEGQGEFENETESEGFVSEKESLFGAAGKVFYWQSLVKYGDINEDGRINSADLLAIQRHIAALKSAEVKQKHPEWVLTGKKLNAADANGDGNVDISDQLAIQRHIAGVTKIITVYYDCTTTIYSTGFVYSDSSDNRYTEFPDVSRNGYKFKGWSASSNGVGTIDTYSKIKSYDHTVYAQWTAESYTVTYDANGGKFDHNNGTIFQKSVDYGQKYAVDAFVYRVGYCFAGWYTSKNGGTKITSNSLMLKDYNHTLYAHWNPAISLDISKKNTVQDKITRDTGIARTYQITVKKDGTLKLDTRTAAIDSENPNGFTPRIMIFTTSGKEIKEITNSYQNDASDSVQLKKGTYYILYGANRGLFAGLGSTGSYSLTLDFIVDDSADVDDSTDVDVPTHECYREILAEYKAAAESDFSEDFLEQTEYVNMGAYNFRNQDKYSIYYRVEDLNRCGNDELIISINEKEAPPNIIDIYGIQNGVPVRIIENNASVGYRSRYYICIDKRIKNTGSGGALDNRVCYYRLLEDEMSLELDEQYVYNGWNGDEYTLIDGNGNVSSISRENYERVFSDADVDFESEWKILYDASTDVDVPTHEKQPCVVRLSHRSADTENEYYSLTAELENPNPEDMTNVQVQLDLNEHMTLIGDDKNETLNVLKPGELEVIGWTVKLDTSDLEEDISLDYSVRVKADGVKEVVASDSIFVQKSDYIGGILDFDKDIWDFRNYKEKAPLKLTDTDKNALLNFYRNIHVDREKLRTMMSEDRNGVCFGLSSIVALVKAGRLSMGDISSQETCIRDIEGVAYGMKENGNDLIHPADANINSKILAYQLLYDAAMEISFASEKDDGVNYETAKNVALLDRYAKEAERTKRPFLIDYQSDVKKEAHEVVGYGHEHRDGWYGWKIDGKIYNDRVLIYDCNASYYRGSAKGANSFEGGTWDENQFENYCIYYNLEEGIWTTGRGSSYFSSENSYLHFIADLDSIPDYTNSVYNAYCAWMNVKNSEDIQIKSGNETTQVNGLYADSNLMSYYTAEGSGDDGLNVLMKDLSSEYEIKNMDGGDLDFEFKYQDYYFDSEIKQCSSVQVAPEGNICVNGNEGNFDLCVTANEGCISLPWSTVNIKGNGNGTISMKNTEEGIVLEGASSVTSVLIENDTKTETLNCPETEGNLLITNQKDEVVIKEDSDSNGVFDKVIASSDENLVDDDEKPDTPLVPETSLSVTKRTTNSVTIAWDKAEGAEGYTIWFRSEYEDEVSRKIIYDGDVTSWTHRGLQSGTKYFYTVRAWIRTDDGYVFSEQSPVQRGTTKPQAARILSASASNGKIKIKLAGEADGAEKYSMCYGSSRSCFRENDFKVGIRTSYTTRTLQPTFPEGTYYVCVKSYRDLGNNKRVYGEWSNTFRVVVK